jgi:hypothetical protein
MYGVFETPPLCAKKKKGALNLAGYQDAKFTGIPSSNTYYQPGLI